MNNAAAYAFTFCAALGLSAFAPGCAAETTDESTESEDDAISAKSSTLNLIKDLPLDTTWAQVPAKVKKELEKNAKKTLSAYEKRLDEKALRAKVKKLTDSPTPAAAKGFDDFVRSVYGAFLPDAEHYVASTAMSPMLRTALQKLYVVRGAAWRLNVKNYGNMTPVEADGTTPIDEFPLPSTAAIAAYKTVAAEAVAELRAVGKIGLTDAEKAIAERALDHARTHAAGSTGFRYGSEDLLTVWGRGGWAYDLVFAHGAAGGSFMQDNRAYAETLNAYYDVPLTYLDKGTAFALPNLTDGLTDPGFLESEFGAGPDANVAAKAYMLLTRWWLERTAENADAQKACTIYNARDAMWEGFTADNLFNADGAKTLQAFKVDAANEAQNRLAQYKQHLVAALGSFATEKSLPATTLATVTAAITAETRFGAVVDTAAKSLDTTGAGLGDAFKAKLADIPTVGGYADGEALRPADTASIARVWADVKSYLGSTYGLDTSKLPNEIIVEVSTRTATGQDGKITAGVATKRTEDYWYATLLHEAHHSYNNASAVFVEGPGWEGAAEVTQTTVFPALVKKSLEARGLGAKAPYYVATNFAGLNALAAKTEATLDVLLAGSCGGGKDTIERARAIGAQWGLTDPAALDDVAVRSHHGTSYLQYTAGSILYSSFVAKMSAGVGRPVDPMHLQKCGLTFAPDSPATIAALAACLGS